MDDTKNTLYPLSMIDFKETLRPIAVIANNKQYLLITFNAGNNFNGINP
tara:strand:+ start:515 stop:661 length:147 start_codon:yes stop_codon:yes gene_type:complete